MKLIRPIVGTKYGTLTVISESVYRNKQGKPEYLCQCECGSKKPYRATALRAGRIKSCGCRRQENFLKGWEERCKNRTSIDKRGLKAMYKSWSGMKSRCNNPKNPSYEYYGGRGISVCSRWEDFDNFLSDMGVRPKGLSLGRIDNNGNYEPGNCRWETVDQQSNNKSNTIFLGETPLSYIDNPLGLSRSCVLWRFKQGWNDKDILSTPSKVWPRHADLPVGYRSGMLEIISDTPGFILCNKGGGGKKKYKAMLCGCDCGKEKYVMVAKLRTRRIKSCGCGK